MAARRHTHETFCSMKTIFHSAFAAAALLLAPGALFAVDQFTMHGVKTDKELQQELNGRGGFGPLERDAGSVLMHGPAAYIVQKLGEELPLPDGRTVQPNGSILGTDGSERMLENTAPGFAEPRLNFSMPPGTPNGLNLAPMSNGAEMREDMPPASRPPIQADPNAPFQD